MRFCYSATLTKEISETHKFENISKKCEDLKKPWIENRRNWLCKTDLKWKVPAYLPLSRTQINNNTDRTLDVVFSSFKGFSFKITMRQKRQKGVTCILRRITRQRESLFYAACALLLWAFASGLLWTLWTKNTYIIVSLEVNISIYW